MGGIKTGLENVTCYVDIESDSRLMLFANEGLRKSLISEIRAVFEKYSVSHTFPEPGGRGGGGGLEPFIVLIRQAWEHRGLFGAAYFFIKWLGNHISSRIVTHLERSYADDKPIVSVHLSLRDETALLYGDERCIPPMLVNLIFLYDEICNSLTKKYPILGFDFSFSVFLPKNNFSVYYQYPAKKQNKYNRNRLKKLLENLVVRNNYRGYYNFVKFKLISRTDVVTSDKNPAHSRSDTYYLFSSSRILSDYVKKLVNTPPPDEGGIG